MWLKQILNKENSTLLYELYGKKGNYKRARSTLFAHQTLIIHHLK